MRVNPYIFDIVPVAPRGLGRQCNGGYRTLLDWSILQKDDREYAQSDAPYRTAADPWGWSREYASPSSKHAFGRPSLGT